MAEQLAKNLKKLFERDEVTVTIVAQESGLDKSRISRVLSGETTNPQIDTLRPLADFFKVTLDQLVGDAPLPTEDAHGVIIPINRLMVPIIDWKNIPYWLDIKDNYKAKETIDARTTISKSSFALTVNTDQYDLTISSGSILIIDPEATPKNRDYFLTDDGNGEITIQQLITEKNKVFFKNISGVFEMKKAKENYKNFGVIVEIYCHSIKN